MGKSLSQILDEVREGARVGIALVYLPPATGGNSYPAR
jgi:hypothetical protein